MQRGIGGDGARRRSGGLPATTIAPRRSGDSPARAVAALLALMALGGGLAAALPATAVEWTSGEHELSLSGNLYTGNAIRITSIDPIFLSLTRFELPRVMQQQNQLHLDLDGSHPYEVSSKLALDFLYWSNPDLPFDDDGQIEVDEAYVDFRLHDIAWRAGKEKIIWGKADQISHFDILTARRIKTPFVNPTLQDRLGQWGVRATKDWSSASADFSLDVVYDPVWSRSQSPDAGTELIEQGGQLLIGDSAADAWFPPAGIYPTIPIETGDPQFPYFIITTAYHRIERPEKDLGSGTFGARLNMIKGEWDTDFYFVTATDPLPHPEIEALFTQTTVQVNGQQAQALQLDLDGYQRHARLNAIGAAAATTWGRLAFRGELSIVNGLFWYRLFDEEQVNELLAEFDAFGFGQLSNQGERHSAIKLIAGGDIEIPNTGIFTSNQLAINKGFGHLDVYFQNGTEVSMSNMIRKGWQDDHLILKWADLINFSGKAAWLGPAVDYSLPAYEDLQLGAGFNFFVGKEFSIVGQYKHHSNLFFSARYFF